jgi:hypothetical protein
LLCHRRTPEKFRSKESLANSQHEFLLYSFGDFLHKQHVAFSCEIIFLYSLPDRYSILRYMLMESQIEWIAIEARNLSVGDVHGVLPQCSLAGPLIISPPPLPHSDSVTVRLARSATVTASPLSRGNHMTLDPRFFVQKDSRWANSHRLVHPQLPRL